MTVGVATPLEDYRITALSVAACNIAMSRSAPSDEDRESEISLAADERRSLVKQEEKMAVRGPEK